MTMGWYITGAEVIRSVPISNDSTPPANTKEVRASMKLLLVLISLAWLCLCAKPLYAQQGIASKYIADIGLASDPNVVLFEDFETGILSDILSRWTNIGNQGTFSLIQNSPPGSKGSRALEIASPGDQVVGGELAKALPQGFSQLYLRYYIHYFSGGTYHHSGGYLGGSNPLNSFPPAWGSGSRPVGNERFSVGVEPNTWPSFNFYAYWMGMECLSAPNNCWGNSFLQKDDPNFQVGVDRWSCVEIMVKVNNPPSAANGELALWVDGQQIIHLGPGYPNVSSSGTGFWWPDPNGFPFPGFQWRNDGNLTLNWAWIQNYGLGSIWLDHIVLAKSYIGPILAGGSIPLAPPTNLRVQ